MLFEVDVCMKEGHLHDRDQVRFYKHNKKQQIEGREYTNAQYTMDEDARLLGEAGLIRLR